MSSPALDAEREVFRDWPQMVRVFARIGLMSFGGPAAQIAVMHRELVEDRPMLTETEFLNALSFCMLLPGPEAMQLATYAGWRLRGVPGGLLAGLLFVVPGALVMAALSVAYVYWGQLPLVAAAFVGIKATVIVVVVEALLRVARKSLKSAGRWVLAGASFAAIFLFAAPFPAIVVAAGIYGALHASTEGTQPVPLAARPRTLATVTTWLAIWWTPVLVFWLAGAERLTEIGLFFSKLAVVTFGGAYAVLAYMAQQVVTDYGWITPAQMLDGLGLAETTPGPLILVTQFIGFLAGTGIGGIGTGLVAAMLTLWVTFTPCFLWIFAGAPYLEWISSRPRLSGALSAITAAVVGVILNLSIWFALHVLFQQLFTLHWGPVNLIVPDTTSLDLTAVGLAALAAVLLLGMRLGLPGVLAITGLAGGAVYLLG